MEEKSPGRELLVSATLLAARIMIAFAFISFSFGQIIHFEDFCESAGRLGIAASPAACWIEIAVLFICGVALALGFKMRWASAALLAGLAVAAALLWKVSFILVVGVLAVMGGVLMLCVFGGGKFSMDVILPALKRRRAA